MSAGRRETLVVHVEELKVDAGVDTGHDDDEKGKKRACLLEFRVVRFCFLSSVLSLLISRSKNPFTYNSGIGIDQKFCRGLIYS